MKPIPSWRISSLCLRIALSALTLAVPLFAQQAQRPNLQPSEIVPLSATGYHELSPADRLGDDFNLTVNFVDQEHLLLTYNPKGLFKRMASCPPQHQDRLVHAVIIEVPSGKVVRQADWYLHDHRRYLWPLGSGNFLLRRLNSLYVVDSNLREKLLLTSSKELLWVSLTPNRTQIVIETAAEKPPKAPVSPTATDEAPKPAFILRFLDRQSLKPQRTIYLNAPVLMDGTETGFADILNKGDIWLVRYGPSLDTRRSITRVRARDTPRILYSSSNSMLVARCCSREGEYTVSAFSLAGHPLWRQHWDQTRYFPLLDGSADNSRFAISTLSHEPYTTAANSATAENDPNMSLEQEIRVIDTQNGKEIESIRVNPVLLSEQNFSLSPDGSRLAVLSDSGIGIYDLPPLTKQERDKFVAMLGDAPVFDVPAKQAPHDENSFGDMAALPDPEANAPQPSSISPTLPSQTPSIKTQIASRAVLADETHGQPLPTFKATAQIVVVDVVVTDSHGHPVKGLKQQDFDVTEDGKPQQVHSFQESNTAATEPVAAAAATPPAPNTFTNQALTKSDSGSTTIILLDLLNTPSQEQQFAKQQLIKYLKSTKAPDVKTQFALCTLAEQQSPHLHLIQGFTRDNSLLLRSATGQKGQVQSVRWEGAEKAEGHTQETIKQMSQGDVTNSWIGLLRGMESIKEEEQARDTDTRVAITADAMEQLAAYLSAIPGRKSVVWLSGSFPIAIANTDQQNSVTDNRNYSNVVRMVSNMLAKSQVAVYPVDVHGLEGMNVNAGSNAGMAPGQFGTPTAPGQLPVNGETITSPQEEFMMQSLRDNAARANLRASVEEVAKFTGGKAFYNTNDIGAAIRTAIEEASNYYTVSYSPSNKSYDGRFRKIKVSLASKGYHLYYRPGYYAVDPATGPQQQQIAHNIRLAAMQPGSPEFHQIRFSIQVAPEGPRKKMDRAKLGDIVLASTKAPKLPAQVEVQHHTIDYTINTADLRLLPLNDGNYRSALTFMIAAFDADGNPLAAVARVGERDLPPDLYQDAVRNGFRVHQEVDVPLNAASMRVGIQDQLSNYAGTLDVQLPLPPLPEEQKSAKSQLPEIEPD